MPTDALIRSLRGWLPDAQHIEMLDDALKALTGDNRRRAQHFAITLRELFSHTLKSRAADAEVERCPWYAKEEGTQGPTRRQRALYLSRGGLSDEFIRDSLGLDPGEFHDGLNEAFKELSKYTHGRPGDAPTDPDGIDKFASRAIGSFGEVFDMIDEVRTTIIQAIEPTLQGEAASTFIAQTIDELDILAGQYSTEGVMFDETSVTEIGPEYIHYRITGTVDVQLHYGGRSDPAQIDDNFPFTCTVVAKVDAPFTFIDNMTMMEVDTASWYDDGEDDAGPEEEGDGSEKPVSA